jgi:hypothetical protein
VSAWLEVLGVFALAAAGTLAGRKLSGLRTPYWIPGFVLPFAFILTIPLLRWLPAIVFSAPISMVTTGRWEFAIFAFACPLAFATLAPRLPRTRDRRAVALGAAAAVIYYSLCPFLIPAIMQGYLSRLETTIDRNGICVQSNHYTCGPAAAVTALRALGLPAEEGQLAVLAHTTPLTGTAPDCLCNALHERYGAEGVSCRFRPFRSIDELRDAGLTIAVVNLSLLIDHYVVVFEVSEHEVVVGDPLRGKQTLSREAFRERWQNVGIVVRRDPP